MLNKDYDRKRSVGKKKMLVENLMGLVAKSKRLVVNRQSQSNSD
jgi:hypothetical protein